MYRILIVEDDPVIADTIAKNIAAWGNEPKTAGDFSDILGEFVSFDPQLVLMDIVLPFFNGYHWCREIRKISKVPILFLSSASDNMNIIMAMNMGGDDFIAKPFDLNVLIAKVQAMLRRTYDFAGQTSLMECGGVLLNLSDTSFTYQGKRTELTKNEFKILQILMENKESPVSRDAIMTRLWESDSFIDDNTLTVNVNRLRKKLEQAGVQEFIHTKKGMGYYIGT